MKKAAMKMKKAPAKMVKKSQAKKPLVGKQDRLPENLKKESAMMLKKSAMMMKKASAMKMKMKKK